MNELTQGVLISGGFLVIGIIATIFGQEYYAWRNHRRKIEYLREEIFFRKKLEYFEEVLEEVERRQTIMIAKRDEFKGKKLSNLKEKDKKIISFKSSILYSKNFETHVILIKLNKIWVSFRAKISNFIKNPKDNTLTIIKLNKIFDDFIHLGADLQSEMRKELNLK